MVILQGTCYPIVLVIYHFVTNYPPNLVAFNNIYPLNLARSLASQAAAKDHTRLWSWQASTGKGFASMLTYMLASRIHFLAGCWLEASLHSLPRRGSLTWQLASLKHIS